MAYPRKEERNKRIVEAKDIEKKSFGEIANEQGIKRNTVCEVYHREKNRELIHKKKVA